MKGLSVGKTSLVGQDYRLNVKNIFSFLWGHSVDTIFKSTSKQGNDTYKVKL